MNKLFPLVMAVVLVGCASSDAGYQTGSKPSSSNAHKAPGEVVQIWCNALYDGDKELARKYTSNTSSEYLLTYGSMEGLIEHFQKGKDNRPRIVIVSIRRKGGTAVVVYTCYYRDKSVKQYEDKLFLEEGIWKVAPQFVQWKLISK